VNIPWMAAVLPEGADDPLAPYLFDLAEQIQREFFDVLRPAEELAWLKVACRLWARLGMEFFGYTPIEGLHAYGVFSDLESATALNARITHILFAKELVK
jgi:alanine racemase